MAPTVQHTATTRPAPQKPLTQQAATTQATPSQTPLPTVPKSATRGSTKTISPAAKPHAAYTIQLASSHDKHALKKLQQTKGEVELKVLGDYIHQSVTKQAALKSKIQTPQVNASSQAADKWEDWKLK